MAKHTHIVRVFTDNGKHRFTSRSMTERKATQLAESIKMADDFEGKAIDSVVVLPVYAPSAMAWLLNR